MRIYSKRRNAAGWEWSFADIRTTDAVEVSRFLRGRAKLMALLVDAPAQVAHYFGDEANIVLEVTTDPETGDRELIANICTALPVAEAMKRLNRMDDEWFLSWAGTRGFIFALEFEEAER